MSYFSTKLDELMRHRLQQDVAGAAGMARSTLSHYISASRDISVDALEQLLAAFPSQRDRHDLVIAHLLDEVPKSEFGSIQISATVALVEEPPAQYFAANEKHLSAALDFLHQRARKDEDIAKLLFDLERVLR